MAEMIVGLSQGQKTAHRTLVVTFDTAYCSDRNTVCLKDFSVHKAAQTVQLCKVKECHGNCLSWYTAVKTTVF